MRTLFVTSVLMLVAGCASTQHSVPAPQSTFSQASSYSAPSNDIAPTAPRAEGDKIVRPDQLVQSFALSVEDQPGLGFEALRAASEQLEKRANEELGGRASLRLRGVRRQATGGKIAGADAYVVVLDGDVVTALPVDAPFWDRGNAVITAQRLAHAIVEEGLGPEGKVKASFSAPSASIAEPEVYRAELVKLWSTRVHSFATAAERSGAPLAVVDCRPPGPVVQRVVSLEEVALSIDLACRLDAGGGK